MFVILIQGVEGVEELLLRLFLAADELDVVDDQNIHIPVFFLNILHALVPDRPYDVAGELFRGDVPGPDLAAIERLYLIPDHLDQMGLAETHSPVDEEGIVFGPHLLNDRRRRAISEFVRGADDEVLGGIAGIKVAFRIHLEVQLYPVLRPIQVRHGHFLGRQGLRGPAPHHKFQFFNGIIVIPEDAQ